MKHSFRFLWNVLLCLCSLVMAHAEDGSDRMENLIYSPRYFGPNAFPMPTLRDGLVSQWYEAELRGEASGMKPNCGGNIMPIQATKHGTCAAGSCFRFFADGRASKSTGVSKKSIR